VGGRRELADAGVQGIPREHREGLMPETAAATLAAEPWAARRRRARALGEQHRFTAEVLRLYGALLEVQERAWRRALDDRPRPATLASYVSGEIVADIAGATIAAGPPLLADAVRESLRDGDPAAFVTPWRRPD